MKVYGLIAKWSSCIGFPASAGATTMHQLFLTQEEAEAAIETWKAKINRRASSSDIQIFQRVPDPDTLTISVIDYDLKLSTMEETRFSDDS